MTIILRNSLLSLLCSILMGCWFSSAALALDNVEPDYNFDGTTIYVNSHVGNNITTNLLKVCCPSPNQVGTIGYTLATPQKVALCVYDQQGSEVIQLIDRTETSGSHHIGWDGRHKDGQTAPSGTYFLMMKTDDSVFLRRMVLNR